MFNSTSFQLCVVYVIMFILDAHKLPANHAYSFKKKV